ncbi:microsomal glutathione S-transferase 1-like [Clavelina lepadiformis]|uniref:microsomal glutathione S-transferase 1-like n=1 Tax=Clavelina lepadiformis TaxID=159417 RepID=UPI004041DC56
MMTSHLYTLENNVFAGFVFYTVLLLMKMLLMTVLTTTKRQIHKAFHSPEDTSRAGTNPEARKKSLLPNENVERVRRCHRNDMENIYLFIFLSLLYIATDPPYAMAIWYFRVYTVSRFLHMLVYLNGIGQPFRGLTFAAGYVTCWILAISTLLSIV